MTTYEKAPASATPAEREVAAFAYTQYKQFFGRGENRYAIYPDYWKDSWGRPPLLGIVAADDEFLAVKLAFDKGILNPYNCSFQPKIKYLGPNKKF